MGDAAQEVIRRDAESKLKYLVECSGIPETALAGDIVDR